MATTCELVAGESVGTRFVAALVKQDWAVLESCFEPRVRFRALIPLGLREAEGSAAAVGYLRSWFADADQLNLLTADIDQIQDLLSMSYRFRAHEDQWYIVEQRAYCDVSDGRIKQVDLLCSGFRSE